MESVSLSCVGNLLSGKNAVERLGSHKIFMRYPPSAVGREYGVRGGAWRCKLGAVDRIAA